MKTQERKRSEARARQERYDTEVEKTARAKRTLKTKLAFVETLSKSQQNRLTRLLNLDKATDAEKTE